MLVIRGQPVTVNYLQGGPKGQGRIRIEAEEVERLKAAIRTAACLLEPDDETPPFEDVRRALLAALEVSK
ncbi:MAG: hypothetical protein HC788_07160 [Sphingopyxis sp.]|nr:hypothetical protein [Sphingopyxis sp.]